MVYGLPAHGEANWDTKLSDSITAVKATADAAETPAGAQAKANAAQAAAVQRANHTGTQTASTISDLTEAVQDVVGAQIVAGANVTATYDDTAGTVTIAADDPQYAVNVVAATGATETLPATYAAHNVTMDQNCTFTFAAPSKAGHTFMLLLSGAFTPTFPASVKWGSGAAPTYTTPALYTFTTLDSGTTWLGVQGGKAFA